MKIKVLPSAISDQIAAGEVVENPCSVIKELVENSIDAQAKNIEIHIKDGGKKSIKIIDDGIGMSAEDAKLSIKRHATSKIQDIDDLFSVQSFGFRGEALAAISSVSQFTLITKDALSDFGTQLSIEAGQNLTISPIGANQGTTIEITDLFYPVPARLQYLKTNETEYRNILKELKAFSLANPTIAFTIYKDDKKSFHYTQTDHPEERINQVLTKTSDNLIPIKFKDSTLKIRGFISRPEASVAHKNQQYIFVNGRKINDYKIAYAIREAYNKSCGIEKHLNPIFIVFIEIDPILVDVNVHPRKLEVKFSDPNDIFRGIQQACFYPLEKASSLPNTGANAVATFPSQNNPEKLNFQAPPQGPVKTLASHSFYAGNFSQLNSSRNQNQNPAGFSNRSTLSTPETNPNNFLDNNTATPYNETSKTCHHQVPTPQNTINQEDELGELKLIGQSGKKYILAENETGLFIFDQHALHERQRFEKHWNEYFNNKKQTQKLLIPETIEFPEEIISIFHEHKKVISNLGFTISFPEDHKITIHATPNILIDQNQSLKIFFESLIEHFETDQIGEHNLDKIFRRLLEYKACRGSVMYGDTLEAQEMQQILNDLKNTKFKWLCAHGRPSYIFRPFNKIDQEFHR